MAKIPDYDKMRIMLAEQDAENLQESEIVDILLYGNTGLDDESHEDILEMFVDIFGTHQIPKVTMRGDISNG